MHLGMQSCKCKVFKFNYNSPRLGNHDKEITWKKNSTLDLHHHFFEDDEAENSNFFKIRVVACRRRQASYAII